MDCHIQLPFSASIQGDLEEFSSLQVHYVFELELIYLNSDIGLWHDDFVQFGGVPRNVFQRATEYSTKALLEESLVQKVGTISTDFLNYSFGPVDSQLRYMLVHMNPPMSDDGDYEYSGRTVYSFASDAFSNSW